MFGVAHFFNYCPLEPVLEVGETVGTDPVVVILCCISLPNGVGASLQRELDPAKSAMVVIPVRILLVLAIPSVDESYAFEIVLLTSQTPVVFVCHVMVTERPS